MENHQLQELVKIFAVFNPKGTTAPVAHTHSSSQMSDGSASPREEEPQFGITPTDFELEADDPNGCMSPNAGKSEARNSSITNGAGAEVPSLRKVVDPSDYNINDIMEEDASRLWLKNLPRPWRALVTRPLNETGSASAAALHVALWITLLVLFACWLDLLITVATA